MDFQREQWQKLTVKHDQTVTSSCQNLRTYLQVSGTYEPSVNWNRGAMCLSSVNGDLQLPSSYEHSVNWKTVAMCPSSMTINLQLPSSYEHSVNEKTVAMWSSSVIINLQLPSSYEPWTNQKTAASADHERFLHCHVFSHCSTLVMDSSHSKFHFR